MIHCYYCYYDFLFATYIKIHSLTIWDLGRDEVGHDKWSGDSRRENK